MQTNKFGFIAFAQIVPALLIFDQIKKKKLKMQTCHIDPCAWKVSIDHFGLCKYQNVQRIKRVTQSCAEMFTQYDSSSATGAQVKGILQSDINFIYFALGNFKSKDFKTFFFFIIFKL